ncbi:trans-sulfuration enzyme family protein [Nakamurella deserti]|uniref:trans-sulfuration enzyme family protein n=1 Tax=Nakamurella deserti TaxID=2164074 RepID=UPI00197C874B|nr:aminotransferase class I/II-fold pyridoxal phosphate-dependent enzyme [Nakamurella deserti]
MTQNPVPPTALSTRAVHVPVPTEVRGRPVSVPIYQTSVFAFDDADAITDALNDPRGQYGYSRFGNPTVRSLEQALATLEGADAAVATSSGMAAITTALSANLVAGDHLVVQASIYGGTAGLLADLTRRWNIRITEVPGDDPDALAAAIEPTTRLLYLETISNPVTAVADIPGMAAVARRHGVLTVVDNTFASPMICRPLHHGADIVVHSTTKYIGGHSDLTGGVVAYADPELFTRGWAYAIGVGMTPDPHAAWLTLRGLQTLPLRIREASANATELAARLAAHPAVQAVHHPSLPGHPQHRLAATLLDRPGAMLSFDLAGGAAAAKQFTSAVGLIQLAASLGGVETLTMHPASSSHRAYTPDQLAAAGISPGTVRLSTGVEDVEDLWSDIAQALQKVDA